MAAGWLANKLLAGGVDWQEKEKRKEKKVNSWLIPGFNERIFVLKRVVVRVVLLFCCKMEIRWEEKKKKKNVIC